MNCGQGCCGSCANCCGALCLTREELELLLYLAQIPFLPVARRADSESPVYLESESRSAQEMAPVIEALWQKHLIRLDYDLPLANFDYTAYGDSPVKGSMAMTARGQQVAEQLEILGIQR